ncbi:carbohydrate oxidase [Artemisia annua]|uniref:Carbohydrate oxidase n=1 Tax=Artemisia annua TaxID=35608 RepID=A0A2U1KM81_ARTAN|nr:carbohydrate oxidase [Artemisia annua]
MTITIFTLFLVLLSAQTLSSTTTSVTDSFVHCLNDQSDPSFPITGLLYAPNNSSFPTVLQTYIQNLRFNESTTPKPILIITALHVSHIQAAVFCEHETAWVQAGATLGELYYQIAEKSNKLAFPAGACPTVGVGGHISGGGYGIMMRKYGLSVDNIIDAELIDVNERTYEQNLTTIAQKWVQVADKLDKDLFLPMIFDVVNDTNGEKTIRAVFRTFYLGNSTNLVAILNKDFPELGLLKSDCIEMSWIESVVFYTGFPLGTPTNVLLSRTPQRLNPLKIKSDYLQKPISKQGFEFIFEKMKELEKQMLAFNPYGGRMIGHEGRCDYLPSTTAILRMGQKWYKVLSFGSKRYRTKLNVLEVQVLAGTTLLHSIGKNPVFEVSSFSTLWSVYGLTYLVLA